MSELLTDDELLDLLNEFGKRLNPLYPTRRTQAFRDLRDVFDAQKRAYHTTELEKTIRYVLSSKEYPFIILSDGTKVRFTVEEVAHYRGPVHLTVAYSDQPQIVAVRVK